MDTFGEWLRQQRNQLKLTRGEFAGRVGCSVAWLRKIEDGEQRPSAQIAELIANCLNLPPGERPVFVKVARGELSVDRLSPVLKPVDVSPAPQINLPISPTPLIGRQREVEELCQLLHDPHCRLLTLVGPGGVGKTRLALEVASSMQGNFADGVYFIPFAAATVAHFIVPVIADAIGFSFHLASHADPKTQLFSYLREKQALLLTDNLEHFLNDPGTESWSSDGKLLAFRSTSLADLGTGPSYHFAIGVYDMASEKTRMLLQNATPSGLAFRPGTHLLAYDEAVTADYFTSGQPDASKARGIMSLNIDTGEITELVKPERGLWLSSPRCSPDGQHIAYDRLATGVTAENSRIWVNNRIGQDEHPISPKGVPSARAPFWAPKGDQVAYLVGEQANGPDTPMDLMVLAVSGGEPRKLGSFANIGPLAWSPDGKQLAFSNGTAGQPQVLIVTVADGSVKELGIGMDPEWEP